MKGVLIILDGLGDLDNAQFNGKTSLEAAYTPNLDFLATRGELGYMYPVKPGFIPESDEAIISIFGNDLMNSTRGQLEAVGSGFELKRGDLALRANFATVDSFEKGNILDRRVGRTLTISEAKELADALNKSLTLSCKFEFKATIQHRGVLVLRGGFSDNICGNDITYLQGKAETIDKIIPCKPLDEEDNSIYTINILNEFLKKSYDTLENHPINLDRKKRGLLPANYILLRGAGVEKPNLKQYRNWVSMNYMPMEIGFSKLSGMKNTSFNYPKLKGFDAYDNLYEGLRKACKYSIKFLKRNFKKADYAYIHIKETDLPGHDNKPLEKKEMLEYIDKTFFNFLRKFAPPKNLKILVTGDHSTPCKLKKHSADPVPVLFFNGSIPQEKKFNERECRIGKLGRISGKELLEKIEFV